MLLSVEPSGIKKKTLLSLLCTDDHLYLACTVTTLCFICQLIQFTHTVCLCAACTRCDAHGITHTSIKISSHIQELKKF